ncbi:MAG: GGDEF domain-containing protein [Betaproteobacteria bacterium]|nr:GGDEF domain-containing protein [Betaproteobacteria bacterium]
MSATPGPRHPRLFGSRLLLMLLPLVTIVACLLLLVVASMEVLSIGRAYVGGEGLWSKAQKDAVYYLVRYARSREENDFRRYHKALAVPLGDRTARIELEKPQPDMGVAYRGFIEGRNHPDDVEGMATLFRRFRNVTYIDKAIGIWAEGDRLIAQLQDAARRLHREITSARSDEVTIGQLLFEIEAINERLTPLEDAFSYTLGEASRWMHGLLTQLLVLTAAGLVAVAAMAMAAVTRRLDRAEGALRRSEERLRLAAQALENTAEAIVITDTSRTIVSVNKAFYAITGYLPEEAVGRAPDFMISTRHDERFYAGLWHSVDEHGRWEGEIHSARKSGEIYPARLSLSAVRENELGAVTHYVGVLKDITEQKRYEERLEYLARHDALTRLPNRLRFLDRSREILSRAARHHGAVGLLFIDLDGFKGINDLHGHSAGDSLLRSAAERLLSCVREEDVVARLGGDEFCVLLDGINDPRDAAVAAQKLLGELGRPFQHGDHELSVSASIGISCYPQDGTGIDTLLQRADAAMYRAKDRGRNNYQFSSEGAGA